VLEFVVNVEIGGVMAGNVDDGAGWEGGAADWKSSNSSSSAAFPSSIFKLLLGGFLPAAVEGF
jgi:hypothetical protein